MTTILKSEEWKNGNCHYFIEQYLEQSANMPLWRYGEYGQFGRIVQSSGLLRKPSRKLNFFQLS